MVQHIVWLQLGRKNASCNLLGFFFVPLSLYPVLFFSLCLAVPPRIFFFLILLKYGLFLPEFSALAREFWDLRRQAFCRMLPFLCIFPIFPVVSPPPHTHTPKDDIVCIVTLLANLLSFCNYFCVTITLRWKIL